jgi:amino acid adenylation domain-containing protein
MNPTAQDQADVTTADEGGEVYTFPLSSTQQGFWLLAQIQEANPAYHMTKAYTLRGALDGDALERALAEIVARHEVLRTVFAMVDGEPAQVVDPHRTVPLVRVELTDLAPGAREPVLLRRVEDEVRRPFDLARGPLLRLVLFRVEAGRHLLLTVAHHLVFDGWSEGVFLRELATLYHAFAAGDPSPLPELPVQFGDFAHWEREGLQGERLEALTAFWRRTLAGAPDLLELPTDFPRPPEPTHEAAYRALSVEPAVAGALDALGRGEGATPFVPLLAAFGVLLHRLSGAEDIVVGTPASGRGTVELEGLIGPLLNTLVLRLDLSGDPSFRELVRRTRETVFAALEHQALPFATLVSELKPRHDLGRNPVFQALFNLDNASAGAAAKAGGLGIEPFEFGTRAAQVDVALSLNSAGDRLTGVLTCRTDLFEPATMTRMADGLRAVLARAAAHPDLPLSALVLDDAERARVVEAWNGTDREYPADATLHGLIRAQAARTPGAVAVRFESEALTYAELLERAGRLASHLRALGVGPEQGVAIRMERSPEMVVSLLGVLMAGGAYLPVDPAYPAQRQRLMLDDSGARVVLTMARLADAAPAREGVRVVCLDRDADAIAACGARPPETGATPDNAAYLIYTSGSTGTPKGAVNTHRGVVNRILWMQDQYGLGADDRVLQKTPFSFDVSVWEFFWPLVTGACLVVARPGAHGDAAYLAGVMEDEGITTAHFVPSMLRAFLEAPGTGRCTGLRRVVCSGEALSAELADRFFARLPGVELHNLYGPTEAAVDVTYQACAPGGRGALVPIGRPVANTRIYVLGARGNPVPAGMPGELHIGGVQVGRGYHARPRLTAERFVPDPFSRRPGARLYRTGDLARWREDGALDFLGRIDAQVKVRGFRIEPGEIEAALRAHPAVADAAVVARREASGAERLVGYVVPRGAAPTPAELREHLGRRLPEHMVPAAFMELAALPLTPSGKLDRAALPEPEVRGERVAPRNPAEEALAAIWAEVLRVPDVGVTDNFFELGGDSILSLRVAARAREAGFPLSIRQVALHPTVAALALQLGGGAPDDGEAGVHTEPFSLVPAQDRARMPDGVVDAYPLAHSQLGMLYHRERSEGTSVYHGLTSYRMEMALDEDAFQRAVLHVTARHPNLRTTFDLESFSEPLQLVHEQAVFPVEFHDLRGMDEAARAAVLQAFWSAEQDRPFDLAVAPQLRFHMHRLDGEAVQFTLLENHAISDGWSLHIVLAEVLQSYLALLRGEGLPPLPPLRTTYRDFIALERRALQSPEARDFWAAQLAGYERPPLPALAAPDGPRLLRGYRWLRRSQVAALRRVARREGVPLKSVLLAAHVRVLAMLAGRADVVTGLSSNGRLETADGDRVAGLFLNPLPLRVRLASGSWSELIRAVHAAELAVMPHRRYPQAAIQAAHGGGGLFDASFTYLNFHVVAEGAKAGEIGSVQTSTVIEETNYPMVASFQHPPGDDRRLGLALECDGRVFTPGQARDVADAYLAALRAIAADPAARHDDAPPLAADARRRIAAAWGGADPTPAAAPLHRLFEAHAARAPEQPCVAAESGAFSRGEVNRLANRLARRLVQLGAGPERRVAVLMDRVPELVPALLAAWKAGAAYVPLDPQHPEDRLLRLVRDAGAVAVVTLDRWADRAAAAGVPVVRLDGDADALAALDGGDLAGETDPAGLAYVVYTSGTTGEPRGVQVEHRQVMHYTGAVMQRLGVAPGESYGLLSTFAADLGNTALFPALASGGTLHVFSERQATDPAALAAALAAAPVGVLKVVPAHLKALLSHADPAAVLPRRRLVLGGDRADWALVERVRGLAPGLEVFNHYGPTEATVGVAAGALDPDARGPAAIPPLGAPLGHARVYVLDGFLQPVPAGTVAEVYLGGPAVARGYLGRPAATAERFVPDPFAEAAGARMYRAGDLARFLDDGRLEFAGRADDQVKIRGFRVEPAEVAAVLRAHPGVADAVVVARHEGGDVRLVAYVAAPRASAPPEEELRAFLARTLPAHAVPTGVVRLDALPLTANGKLDRRALPSPEEWEARAEAPVEPRTAVEETLVQLWKEVLKTDRLGVYDAFLDLGGDSIRAILAAARVRKAFGISLSVDALFAARTVAGLAGTVEMALQARGSAPLAPIAPVPRDGALPLSFAQQRFWYAHVLQPDSPAQNLPLAIRLRGTLDEAALRRALDELARRHEVLRSRFPTVDGEPRLAIDPPAPVPLARADLLTTVAPAGREAAVLEAVRAAAWRPFSLEGGPMLRALLARGGEQDHALGITLHHLVSDGWSVGILLRELGELYSAFAEGRPSPLPELPVQYADYAVWQREHFRGEVLEAQLAYWRGKLKDAPVLELPTDRPRPAQQGYRGAAERAALSQELTAAFRETSQREGVTLFMSLLAAWAVLLHHRAGQDDLVVGAPVATHRDREELQGVVGAFLNTLALRVDLSGDPSFRDLLARVRGTALEAYSHQELSFDRLVEALNLPRGTGRPPLVQVWFNHSGIPGARVRFAGLKVEGVDVGDPAVKFDLQLSTEELGGRLAASLRYNSDLFERATALALLADLEALLGRVAADPAARLSELRAVLDDEARARDERAWGERDQSARRGLQAARRKAVPIPT